MNNLFGNAVVGLLTVCAGFVCMMCTIISTMMQTNDGYINVINTITVALIMTVLESLFVWGNYLWGIHNAARSQIYSANRKLRFIADHMDEKRKRSQSTGPGGSVLLSGPGMALTNQANLIAAQLYLSRNSPSGIGNLPQRGSSSFTGDSINNIKILDTFSKQVRPFAENEIRASDQINIFATSAMMILLGILSWSVVLVYLYGRSVGFSLNKGMGWSIFTTVLVLVLFFAYFYIDVTGTYVMIPSPHELLSHARDMLKDKPAKTESGYRGFMDPLYSIKDQAGTVLAALTVIFLCCVLNCIMQADWNSILTKFY